MNDDPFNVIAEHYHQLENLPVMVCVLETAGGLFFTGNSTSGRERFNPDLARNFALSSANHAMARWRERHSR